MGNCNGKLTNKVCDDFNNFFQVYLEGGAWFQRSRDQMATSFPEGAQCFERIHVVDLHFNKIDCGAIGGPTPLRDLQQKIQPGMVSIADWCDAMTLVSACLYPLADKGKCSSESNKKRKLDRLFARLLDDQLSVAEVPDGALIPNSPEQLCRRYSRWIRKFVFWCDDLSDWENALYECHRNSKGGSEDKEPGIKLLQITPPTWPPWPKFDITQPD